MSKKLSLVRTLATPSSCCQIDASNFSLAVFGSIAANAAVSSDRSFGVGNADRSTSPVASRGNASISNRCRGNSCIGNTVVSADRSCSISSACPVVAITYASNCVLPERSSRCRHKRFSHTRLRKQLRFDSCGFDLPPMDAHAAIQSPQLLYVAVGQPASTAVRSAQVRVVDYR